MTTKEKILDTLLQLMAQKGYDKSSIGQIAKALGIKKPSVYYYFTSKEEILLTLYDRLIHQFIRPLDDSPLQRENFRDFMLHFGYEAIDRIQSDTQLHRVFIEFYVQSQRISSLKERIRASEASYKQYLRQLLEKGMDCGALDRALDLDTQVDSLMNTLYGLEFTLVFGMSLDPKAIWQECMTQLFQMKSEERK